MEKWAAYKRRVCSEKKELTKKEVESKRELEILDQKMAEIALMTEALEEKMGMVVILEAEGLTKDLVDEFD